MSSGGTEGILLDASKSPELEAAFQIVADAEHAGARKFSPQVGRKLARIITCRCYAPALLELCHLVTVAKACSRRRASYEGLFWESGPARASGFGGYICERLKDSGAKHPRFAIDKRGVEIVYADGRFRICYARMPLLSALMEFMVTAIGYRDLDVALQDMLDLGPTKDAVSRTAKRLSRSLYGYLSAHLPSVQNQRKFSRLTGFLANRQGGDFDETAIDDEAILAFWLSESAEQTPEASNCRTFLSVFRGFAHLRRALSTARDLKALRHPRAIGPDVEAGEIDPADVLTAVEASDEGDDSLTRLDEPSARRVKFLTKTESGDLALFVEHRAVSGVLPLSLLRAEVFGTIQTRVSQALRRKLPPEELRGLMDATAADAYCRRRARLDELHGHIERVLLAGVHVLVRARRWEALSIATELRPDIDWRPLRRLLFRQDEEHNVVTLAGGKFGERLLLVLEDPAAGGAAMASLMRDARRAFKSLGRRGFREHEIQAPDVVEGVVAGIQPLLDLRRELAVFRDRLSSLRLPEADWPSQFDRDRQVFRNQFFMIYGVRHEQNVEKLYSKPTRSSEADLRRAFHA